MAFDHPFYFLRHGETTWNAIGRTQGQLDAPLSDRGRVQAVEAAEALRDEPVARIVASPLSRARDTAEAVAAVTGAEIDFDPALMEFHAGDWQGEYHGEAVRAYFSKQEDPPNGEAYADFCARVWAAMARAVAAGPDTLIVCHGGLWYAAQEHVRIEPALRPMPNALPIHVTPGPDHWRARVIDAAPKGAA